MNNYYRMGKGVTERYTSIAQLREAWGLDPIVKRTKDEVKLAKQRERFCNRHKCKACGLPMTFIGGNQMVCANENCKGIELIKEDKEGQKIKVYTTSYDLLDELGAEIASNIFD